MFGSISGFLFVVFIFYMVEKLIGFKNIYVNIKNNGFKNWNMDRVTIVKDWAEIKKEGLNIAAEDIQAYNEQYMMRRLKCGACVEAGKCTKCGCSINELMATPSAQCDDDKWYPMVFGEEYYKKRKRILNGREFKLD